MKTKKKPAPKRDILAKFNALSPENQAVVLENGMRLMHLCNELDMEMDGVRCPASASAILNAIRAIVESTKP